MLNIASHNITRLGKNFTSVQNDKKCNNSWFWEGIFKLEPIPSEQNCTRFLWLKDIKEKSQRKIWHITIIKSSIWNNIISLPTITYPQLSFRKRWKQNCPGNEKKSLSWRHYFINEGNQRSAQRLWGNEGYLSRSFNERKGISLER